MRSVAIGLVLWSVLCGCEGKPRAVAQNSAPPPSASSADVEPAKVTESPARLFGRWKGPYVCLELYPSGEFQLSVTSKGPKVVLSGEVSQRRVDATEVELVLHTTRIFSHHWVSSCRKEVEDATLLETYDALGVTLSTVAATTLALRILPGDQVELCAKQCETLEAEEPRLLGHWRSPGLSDPAGWRLGQPLDLDVREDIVSLTIAADDGQRVEVSAPIAITVLDPGRFELVLTQPTIVKWSASATEQEQEQTEALILGAAAFRAGEPTKLTVERVRGGVELCRATTRCVELPRYDDF